MIFSSMIFLWLFLPVVLGSYFIIKDEYKNILLLVASLIFYAWGEPIYIILMLITITINYVFGILIDRVEQRRKLLLFLTVMADVGLLFYFKYFNMFVDAINSISGHVLIQTRDIALPIGISFYTFQSMSYVIDLYRGEIKVQKNWLKLALYIAFFPQLIAGPIVKYKDICLQIDNRKCSVSKFAYGIKRFAYGMGKKVIIANTMAEIVDSILEMNTEYIGTSLSWCVAICYTLQIYFDFSGYSDMAIGLGKMFGFDVLENFNYPYVSQSIQEFWRRWHISLSTWFKEYLYIPLGGNRKGKLRTYFNLFVVFFVTGMWHGASYTFIIWGLYHGLFSIFERIFLGKWIQKNPIKILNHIYALLVVIVGWVLFRADSLGEGIWLIKNMFIYRANVGYDIMAFVDMKDVIVCLIAIMISTVIPMLTSRRIFVENNQETKRYEIILCVVIMTYSIILLVGNTYNPFIYFRF